MKEMYFRNFWGAHLTCRVVACDDINYHKVVKYVFQAFPNWCSREKWTQMKSFAHFSYYGGLKYSTVRNNEWVANADLQKVEKNYRMFFIVK